MVKSATSQSAGSEKKHISSPTQDAKVVTVSSLLDEPDEISEENTVRYSLEEILAMGPGETHKDAPEYEIELDDAFWENARLVMPNEWEKTSVHLRLDRDVFDWFKAQGKGHLTRMNAVLRAYYLANRDKT